MISLKNIKDAEKAAAQQQAVVLELNALAKDIERCERTLSTLRAELDMVNSKYAGQRNTREDIAYLTGLLDCAKKKLAWEKQIASLQKRTPALLEKMTAAMNDPRSPMSNDLRAQMLRSLQGIQAAMERLHPTATTEPAPAP